MTRQEQIEKVADNYLDEVYELSRQPSIYNAFIAGAKWADEHQKLPTIPISEIEDISKELITEDWKTIQDRLWEMIERNLKYQFTIKACKWLRLHMPFGEVDKELRDNVIDEFESFMKK